MHLSITSKNIGLSDYLRDVVDKKTSKFNRYFKPDTEVHVTLSVERNRHIVEITIPFDGVVIRAEEVTGDMYASIDTAVDKIIRQVRKHRTRLESRLYEGAFSADNDTDRRFDSDDDADNIPSDVVRTKRFAIKPMDVEEAKMQMELLGHSFFVFLNANTQEVNVLYRRNDKQLGLIEPELS